MLRKRISKTLQLLSLGACISLSACSATSYVSQEALSGTLMGSAVGSGVGWLIGNEIGDKPENIAVNAAIGGGVGLLAGALLNERNISIAREREVAIREAKLISNTQRELDTLRTDLEDSSAWGRNEVKPWNERYTGTDSHRPFKGSLMYQRP